MMVNRNMMHYESTVPIKAFHRQENHTIQHIIDMLTEQSLIFTIMHKQNMPVGSFYNFLKNYSQSASKNPASFISE